MASVQTDAEIFKSVPFLSVLLSLYFSPHHCRYHLALYLGIKRRLQVHHRPFGIHQTEISGRPDFCFLYCHCFVKVSTHQYTLKTCT